MRRSLRCALRCGADRAPTTGRHGALGHRRFLGRDPLREKRRGGTDIQGPHRVLSVSGGPTVQGVASENPALELVGSFLSTSDGTRPGRGPARSRLLPPLRCGQSTARWMGRAWPSRPWVKPAFLDRWVSSHLGVRLGWPERQRSTTTPPSCTRHAGAECSPPSPRTIGRRVGVATCAA